MNEHEGPSQNRVEIPTLPAGSFGQETIEQGRLGEWLEFANTPFARIWLKARMEMGRVRSIIAEELTGEPTLIAEMDLKHYELLKKGLINEGAFESDPHLARYMAHHLGEIRSYLKVSIGNPKYTADLEQFTSSPEVMFNRIVEHDFRRFAKGFMDKEEYPNSSYKSEEELFEKMMSMVDRNIE